MDGAVPTAILTSLPQLDALRSDPNTTWTRDEGSNLDVLSAPGNDDAKNLAICHLYSLNPFTYLGVDLANQGTFEDAAGTALAVHHLNTGDGRIIPQLEGLPDRCNIRFTVEFADDLAIPSVAVDYVVNVTSRLPGGKPRPCAFVGAYRSAISIATSILTGMWNYPQVSGISLAADLDDKLQYPLFARTTPSDDGYAVPILQYFYDVLGIRHLAVLNINDAYGNSFVKGLRSGAERYFPDFSIYQAPVDGSVEAIRTALTSIKATQYRYILALVFGADGYDLVMSEAYSMGLAGKGDYQWHFANTFESINGRMIEADSPLRLAYSGVGMIEATGGVLGVGLKGYENFMKIASEMNNAEDLEYLFSLFPNYDTEKYQDSLKAFNNFLTPLWSGQAPFLYDAVVALGLAACAAVDPKSLTLDGRRHYDTMVNSTFDGITGKMVFNTTTGTRESIYTTYKVANYLDHPASDGMVRVEETFTHLYEGGTWRELTPFVFHDGSTNIPIDIPPVAMEDNAVRLGVRIGVLVLCGLVLIMALGFMNWTYQHRKARVVLASQPFFLHIICVGAIVMACTIIPMSIDHGLVSLQGCTRACISIPWLGTMGFSMTVSALFTKTRRINILLNSANRMQRMKVTIWDVARPMIFLLGVNSVVLSVMTALSPPHYEMIVENTDSFGRPDEIRGECDFSVSYAYIASVSLVNAIALLLTIVQAFKARNLSMEFAESAQIFRALMSVTMVMFVGGPVLLLSQDNPNTLLFVASAIIFVACSAILLLLFVPKIQFWLNAKKEKGNSRLRISGLVMTRPGSMEDDSEYTTEELTGMKILTTMTPAELLKENEELKRLLREKEAKAEGRNGSRDELKSVTRAELESRTNTTSISKDSRELSQTPIEEQNGDDLEKSQGTIVEPTGIAERSELPSPPAVPSRDEGSPSAFSDSNERLMSLREKKDLAKMKFDTLITRDSSERSQ